jgi:hypothetical protein
MDFDEGLVSCDTFVVMGDVTNTGEVVFGKNSDRPKGEVQEVVSFEPGYFEPGEKLKAGRVEEEENFEMFPLKKGNLPSLF